MRIAFGNCARPVTHYLFVHSRPAPVRRLMPLMARDRAVNPEVHEVV